MNRSYPKSRLATVEQRKTLKTIAWSILFVIFLSGLLFYFGIPLLIKMAVFISELKSPTAVQERDKKAVVQTPQLDALPEATPSASIIVSGFAPPKSSVIVLLNSEAIPATLANNDGSFQVHVSLREDTNIIVARTKDENGSESLDSTVWTVIHDSTPPELAISNPIDNTTLSGDANRTIQIQGITDIGATVTINNRIVLVATDGSFIGSLQLSQGDNHLDVVSADKAGNQTLAQITVNWQQ